jgi:hypothetical protein
MAVSFGCTTASPQIGTTDAYGVANSQSETGTAEIAQARNALGLVTHEQAYSRTVKRQCTAVMTGTVPTAGSLAKVFGVEALVESIAVTETNTGYRMCETVTTKSDSAAQAALA